MGLTVSFALLLCPSCGEPIMPSGMATTDNDPAEHLTVTCENCRKLISVTRDPATGSRKAAVARPS